MKPAIMLQELLCMLRLIAEDFLTDTTQSHVKSEMPQNIV